MGGCFYNFLNQSSINMIRVSVVIMKKGTIEKACAEVDSYNIAIIHDEQERFYLDSVAFSGYMPAHLYFFFKAPATISGTRVFISAWFLASSLTALELRKSHSLLGIRKRVSQPDNISLLIRAI